MTNTIIAIGTTSSGEFRYFLYDGGQCLGMRILRYISKFTNMRSYRFEIGA